MANIYQDVRLEQRPRTAFIDDPQVVRCIEELHSAIKQLAANMRVLADRLKQLEDDGK